MDQLKHCQTLNSKCCLHPASSFRGKKLLNHLYPKLLQTCGKWHIITEETISEALSAQFSVFIFLENHRVSAQPGGLATNLCR